MTRILPIPRASNVGSVIWRTEQVKASGAQKADIAVRAEIESPTASSR
jgi:hypothetical protein